MDINGIEIETNQQESTLYMPRKKIHKSPQKKIQRYCISCNVKINQNAYFSEKLNKKCNKCYTANTNKEIRRKTDKKGVVKRRKDRLSKLKRNYDFF